jgi:hypothetical protein
LLVGFAIPSAIQLRDEVFRSPDILKNLHLLPRLPGWP